MLIVTNPSWINFYLTDFQPFFHTVWQPLSYYIITQFTVTQKLSTPRTTTQQRLSIPYKRRFSMDLNLRQKVIFSMQNWHLVARTIWSRRQFGRRNFGDTNTFFSNPKYLSFTEFNFIFEVQLWIKPAFQMALWKLSYSNLVRIS